jgi:hypothetical protein
VPVRATSRLWQSASTLAAIGAVLAITATLTIGTVVLLDQQGTRGIQAELDTRVGADLALRASIALAANPQRQDEQVRDAVETSFAGSHLDLEVIRTLESHVTVLALSDDPDELERGGSARSIPDFDDRVDFVAGVGPVARTRSRCRPTPPSSSGLRWAVRCSSPASGSSCRERGGRSTSSIRAGSATR